MAKKSLLGALSLIAAICVGNVFTGCNSNNESYTYSFNYGSTAIKSFSLQNNSRVLDNLDSVYFSIDLVNAKIFNAQPLPRGTAINSLPVNITTDNCSKVELNFRTKWNNDTTIDYLQSSNDSINFANGPVDLYVVSYDGIESRHYNLYVNVWDTNPDSLAWAQATYRFPSEFSSPQKAKAVEAGENFYMLSAYSGSYSLGRSDMLYEPDSWEYLEVDFGDVTPVIDTFTGTSGGSLYIIGSDDLLYRSDDEGASWTSTGTSMKWIYGSYNDDILGSFYDNSGIYSVLYANGSETRLQQTDPTFPVINTSNVVVFNSDWAVNPMAMFVGGQSADGTVSGDSWSFDGSKWAKTGSEVISPATAMSLFKYTYASTDSDTWRVSYEPLLYAVGGKGADGRMKNATLFSADMGRHWVEAPANYVTPSSFPSVSGMQLLVQDYSETVNSRAVKPITEWECPFIYAFGGYSVNGVLNSRVWKGVLVRYTFKPIQ